MSKIKKVLRLSSSLILLLLLSLTVCAGQSVAKTSKDEVYKLKFNFFGTNLAPPVARYLAASDRIKQKTNGIVVITPFFSNTLLYIHFILFRNSLII